MATETEPASAPTGSLRPNYSCGSLAAAEQLDDAVARVLVDAQVGLAEPGRDLHRDELRDELKSAIDGIMEGGVEGNLR